MSEHQEVVFHFEFSPLYRLKCKRIVTVTLIMGATYKLHILVMYVTLEHVAVEKILHTNLPRRATHFDYLFM